MWSAGAAPSQFSATYRAARACVCVLGCRCAKGTAPTTIERAGRSKGHFADALSPSLLKHLLKAGRVQQNDRIVFLKRRDGTNKKHQPCLIDLRINKKYQPCVQSTCGPSLRLIWAVRSA